MIWDYLWLIWVISSLSVIRIYFSVFAHFSQLIAKPSKKRFGTPRIIFQITTKGNIPIVQETVDRTNSVCGEIGYSKYEVWVVTDVPEKFKDCRTVVVPADYACNAIYKGRALQYALELRRKEGKNTQDIYIFHLDDESFITKQTLCSLLTYLEAAPSPISEGLVTYPLRQTEKLKITNLIDTLRPFGCFECIDFMSRGSPAYIHGSNLLIRGDMEEKVGWSNGKTIAEDSLFAIVARRKFGPKIFGWHGGVVEEESPFTLSDLFRQRRRWFGGMLQNLKYLNLRERLSQISRLFLLSTGFLSGAILIVALFIPQYIPSSIVVALAVTCALWLLSYQIGAHLNGKYLSRSKKIRFHIMTLLSSPLLGLIESSIRIISLVKRTKTFELVKK